MYSLISLFLTCCGLFGMALYATEQRTKEIGIRKVNGATSPQIMLLLNSQFISWIGISFIIAIPITWLLLNRWLENFVYHTDMNHRNLSDKRFFCPAHHPTHRQLAQLQSCIR